jgi:AraC-like DNA-binding protein
MFLGNYRLAKSNMTIKKPYFTDTDKKIFNYIETLRNSKYFNFLKNMGYVNLILGEILDKTLLNKKENKINENALTEILEYIEKNFYKKITLEEISNAIGYSKSHISHTLSAYLQMDFRTYLNRVRLAKFINMASIENKISIKAKACGFESIKTFYRSFKQEFGCSPSQYFKINNHN